MRDNDLIDITNWINGTMLKGSAYLGMTRDEILVAIMSGK